MAGFGWVISSICAVLLVSWRRVGLKRLTLLTCLDSMWSLILQQAKPDWQGGRVRVPGQPVKVCKTLEAQAWNLPRGLQNGSPPIVNHIYTHTLDSEDAHGGHGEMEPAQPCSGAPLPMPSLLAKLMPASLVIANMEQPGSLVFLFQLGYRKEALTFPLKLYVRVHVSS